jgi:hypothetical protein
MWLAGEPVVEQERLAAAAEGASQVVSSSEEPEITDPGGEFASPPGHGEEMYFTPPVLDDPGSLTASRPLR